MIEGWVEIEFHNPLNCGIVEKIKTCNRCKWMKHQLIKTGNRPIYYDICSYIYDHNFDKTHKPFIVLEKRFSSHINSSDIMIPPGFDGEDCPFDKETKRDLKINNILK